MKGTNLNIQVLWIMKGKQNSIHLKSWQEKETVFKESSSFRVDKQMKETFREAVDIVEFSDNGPGVSQIKVVRLWSVAKKELLAIFNLKCSLIFLIVTKEVCLSW